MTLPDGSSATKYVYDDLIAGTDAPASYVRVIDPAGKQKRYQMDGLGHLTRATEDPNGLAYATNYTYDVLNHLIQVQQTRGGTTQTRTFNYKSGSTVTGLLQSATNPENGTVSYTYNSNYLLATRTDAKGVVTGYTYDSQNRLVSFGCRQTASSRRPIPTRMTPVARTPWAGWRASRMPTSTARPTTRSRKATPTRRPVR